jgi:CelD/BcsL family acetyltransferase involved in cellulose biosynthesis
LVAVDQDGRAVGILPLGVAHWCGVKIFSLGGYIQPIRTLIIDQGAVGPTCAALAAALFRGRSEWHVLRLGPVELSSPEMRALANHLRSASPRIDIRPLPLTIAARGLPEGFEGYRAHVLGTRFAKDIDYYERRLRREGGMVIRHYRNPSEDDLHRLLIDCRAVEGRSWLSESRNPQWRFSNELDFCFWKEAVARGLPPGGRFDTWIMDFDGKPISYCVTLTSGGVRYMIANQYDSSYDKYSSGSVLYMHALQDAYRGGVQAVDFGEGDLHYKKRWGGAYVGERSEIIAFPRGFRGRTLSGLYGLSKTLRAKKPPKSSGPSTPEVSSPAETTVRNP